MAMEYLKPVRQDIYYVTPAEIKGQLIDTHGLMAKIKVDSESILVNTENEFFGGYCYSVDPGEEFCFCGKLYIRAKSSSAYVYVLYFDAV